MEFRQAQFTILTFRELNKIVNRTWSMWHDGFDCVSRFGWTNDSDHVVLDVQPPRDPLVWDKFDRHRHEVANTWAHGIQLHYANLTTLLESLCAVGVIPPGHYVIRVSW